MNVLIFVMTMLMLLTLMTYAKLETFRTSQIFQILFEERMMQNERNVINVAAAPLYRDITVNTEEPKKETEDKDASKKQGENVKEAEAENPSRLFRYISIGMLLDKKKREENPEKWEQTKILLKNLMNQLYAKQPFFIDIAQERPQLVDELISAVVHAIDSLPDKKLKKAKDLANLELEDLVLNTVFYDMLKSSIRVEENQTANSSPILNPEDGKKEEKIADSADSVLDKKVEDYISPEGESSLLDYVGEGQAKTSVYLAPKEVLQAIFLNEAVVDDVIKERNQYYKQARSGADLKELSKAFKSQFEPRRDASIDSKTLDFSVTTTNPNK